MELDSQERQLELFDSARAPSEQSRLREEGIVRLRLRYDQCILVSIAVFMGLSVVFAFGVERGKRLARSERPLVLPSSVLAKATEEKSGSTEKLRDSKNQTSSQVEKPKKIRPLHKQKVEPNIQEERSVAQGKQRYAIQVITYSKTQRAVNELKRLRESGESAFLVKRSGMTMVYVGPFPSKDNAKEKLVSLKRSYQDCFVRNL